MDYTATVLPTIISRLRNRQPLVQNEAARIIFSAQCDKSSRLLYGGQYPFLEYMLWSDGSSDLYYSLPGASRHACQAKDAVTTDSKLFANHFWLSHLARVLKWFLFKGHLLTKAMDSPHPDNRLPSLRAWTMSENLVMIWTRLETQWSLPRLRERWRKSHIYHSSMLYHILHGPIPWPHSPHSRHHFCNKRKRFIHLGNKPCLLAASTDLSLMACNEICPMRVWRVINKRNRWPHLARPTFPAAVLPRHVSGGRELSFTQFVRSLTM